MKGSNSTYFGNIKEAVSSLLQGLQLSLRHLREAKESRKPMGIADDKYFEQQTGIVTLQYPKESLPVPDNGRYRLHNEIEDCIVCDKCAKICPVDCIDIEPVKAVEEIGKTSDGTPKRLYAAKFDIDMGKCCFCGLCTTVCPTECLTMTKAYDFSEFDSADHIYAFSEMTPLEILQKKKELEEYKKQKEAQKPAVAASGEKSAAARPGVARPGLARPAVAPNPASSKQGPEKAAGEVKEEGKEAKSAPRPAFKPKIKTAPPKNDSPAPSRQVNEEPRNEQEEAKAAPKPRFRPKIKASAKPADAEIKQETEKPMKPDTAKGVDESSAETAKQPATGGRPRPVMKPTIKHAARPEQEEQEGEKKQETKLSRPLIRPRVQAKAPKKDVPSEETKKTPPLVGPTAIPKKPAEEEKSDSDKQEEEKVKPDYRPKPPIRKKEEDE